MNDEFSTKLHPEKDATHGLIPVLKRKRYLQRELAKVLQEVLMACSHMPVAPSERLVLCGLSLFSDIFVMSNEGSMSQAEALSNIYTRPTPGRETQGLEQWLHPTAHPVPGDWPRPPQADKRLWKQPKHHGHP